MKKSLSMHLSEKRNVFPPSFWTIFSQLYSYYFLFLALSRCHFFIFYPLLFLIKSHCHFYICSTLSVLSCVFFPTGFFQNFLFIFDIHKLPMMCPYVMLLYISCLQFIEMSQICSLMLFINFERILAMIYLNIFSTSFSYSSPSGTPVR